MRPLSTAMALALSFLPAQPAVAQEETWISSLTPGDAAFVGWAHTLPHGPLWFHCAGRPDGRPISPYGASIAPDFTHALTVELRHQALGTAAPGATRGDISLEIDETRYQLPPLDFRVHAGLSGWFVDLSMGDALFDDIRNGGSVTVYAGATPIATHAGAISTAVTEVTGFCADQFTRAGVPVPQHAAGAVAAPGTTPSPVPGVATPPPQPSLETFNRMVGTVRAHCGEPFDIDPEQNGWTTTELNGDGEPDTVLFWGAVSCRSGPFAGSAGGGNCGASQCLTSIFISGTGRGTAADAELFSQGPVFDPTRPGEVGFVARLAVCRQAGLMPDCLTWHRWTDTGLVRTN